MSFIPQTDWVPDLRALPASTLWCDGTPGCDPQSWDGQEWPEPVVECDGPGSHVLGDLVLCDKHIEWWHGAGRYPRPIHPKPRVEDTYF